MTHWDDVRERVRERCDLVDIVQRHVPLQRRGNRWVACCPFHEEKTPSFYVTPERGTYHCFGCGASGDVFKFVMEREKLTFKEALHQLADQVGVEIEVRGGAERDDETAPRRLTAALQFALERYRQLLASPRGAEARRYLDQRGIEDEWRTRFEVGFAPDQQDSLVTAAMKAGFTKRTLEAAGLVKDLGGGRCVDHFHGRVLFPIRDATSRLVGFGGRILPRLEHDAQGQPVHVGKYVNSPETALFKKSRLLYGLDLIIAQRTPFDLTGDEGRWGLIVEGYTDVIACHKAGLPYAVAALGTAFTSEHVTLLKRYLNGVVVVFDGDRAGIEAAHKALPLLIAGDLRLRVLALPGGEDPADYLAHATGDEFHHLLRTSGDEFAFLRRALVERFGVCGGERPEEAARWLLHFFAGASPLRRDRAFAHLADTLKMSEALLRARGAAFERNSLAGSSPRPNQAFVMPRPPFFPARPQGPRSGAPHRAGGFAKRGGKWGHARGRWNEEPLAPPPVDWSQVPPGMRRALRDLIGVLVALPSLAAVARMTLPPDEVGPLSGAPGGIEYRAYVAALSMQADHGSLHLGDLIQIFPDVTWIAAAVEAHAGISYDHAKEVLEVARQCFVRCRAEERVRVLDFARRSAQEAGDLERAATLELQVRDAQRAVYGISSPTASPSATPTASPSASSSSSPAATDGPLDSASFERED